MEKTITVGNKQVKLKTSAGLVRRYRSMFNRNLTSDMITVERALLNLDNRAAEQTKTLAAEAGIKPGSAEYKQLQENVETDFYSDLPVEVLTIFENLAYAMNKFADPEQPDDIDTWLDQFETFSIYEIFPELLMLWNTDSQTTAVAKKK